MHLIHTFQKIAKQTGDQGFFFLSFLRTFSVSSFEWREFLRQCYFIGFRSLGIIALTGFIIGFVFTLQSLPTLKDFGAEGFVPSMVCIAVIREVGPVITGLICAGKIASGIGAELGSMNVTEQIASMEISGANPLKYLVATRILACACMVPLLTIYADTCSIIGGYVGVNSSFDITLQLYFSKSFDNLYFADIIPAIIKTFFFGLSIGFVGCYKGFKASKGTQGVGDAANAAVVTASLWIIILDAVAARITNVFIDN